MVRCPLSFIRTADKKRQYWKSDLPAVGTEQASQLLVTVGDNPDRLGHEAQFAALVEVAPIPASSGQNQSAPAQQRRSPQCQPCPASGSPGPHGLLPTYQGLRGQTHGRGQRQKGNHALPQALHSMGNLPADHKPSSNPKQQRPSPDTQHTRIDHHDLARELGQWPSRISFLGRRSKRRPGHEVSPMADEQAAKIPIRNGVTFRWSGTLFMFLWRSS